MRRSGWRIAPFFFYSLLSVLAVLVHGLSSWGGIYGCLVSILAIITSRTILYLVLAFLNFSLSIAFDNFLRADPVFYFYRGDASPLTELSLVSVLLFLVIGLMDQIKGRGEMRGRLVNFKPPEVSPLLCFPLLFILACVAIFVVKNESFVLSARYDAYELQKYPMLEYMALVIAFALLSSNSYSKKVRFWAYGVAIAFTLVMLATSYRMVAISCALSMSMIYFNGKRISKSFLVVAWLLSYAGLTIISYWRIGVYDLDPSNIFGYFEGRLDNTFTGVIETAMVYISIGESGSFLQNMIYMIGATLPIPNSFIPDSMLYIVYALQNYYFPGGGALAGFVIFFNYIYLIPYFIYFYFAFMLSNKSGIAGLMYLILFTTVARWWLYGPYVIFKFFGFVCFLFLVNRLIDWVFSPYKKNRLISSRHSICQM